METQKAFAPLFIIILVAAGLIGGTATGYAFREPIKKAVSGKSTTEEIDEAVGQAKEQQKEEYSDTTANQAAAGQSKFELEGVVTALDITGKILTVKIKSSTDSIKELRLSETPIALSATLKIVNGSIESATISDIPLNSQVHVGGTIAEGKLTAAKVTIQKEEVAASSKHFSIGGTVASVGADSMIIKVSTANNSAKANKGKDIVVKISAATVIEKSDQAIAITDIKAGDSIHITGVITNDIYTAAKIVVNVKEEAGKIEPTASTNSSKSNGNSKN